MTSQPNTHFALSSHQDGKKFYLAAVCLVASLGGLLFGFDVAVIAGTIEKVKTQFGLSDIQQGWFASAALIGCILGAACSGTLGDRFGRRPMLQIAAVLFFVSALFSAIPESFTSLIIARIIGGLGVGMASVIAPMYISEMAPPKIRGRLVAFYQLSIVIGILSAYYCNLTLLDFSKNSPDAFSGEGILHWTMISEVWRSMFGAEMIPATLFFLCLLFVPESPRFLIETGKKERGFSILEKISGTATAQKELDEISQAVEQEEGSLAELFRPGLRTALMVGIGLSVFGQLSGVNIVISYGPKILMAAGFGEFGAFLGQVGFGVINLIFTIAALFMIDRLGRRPLLLYGFGVVTVMLAVIGTLFLMGGGGDASEFPRHYGIMIGIALCIYMAAIAFSISAVIWVLTPEIFPNRVRGRAASIATLSNWSTSGLGVFFFPWFMATFSIAASFYTFAVICFVGTLFFRRFVPETKGKSLEEIEQLWSR